MKGIVDKGDGRFIAQYWSTALQETVYIGMYNSEEEAITERTKYITSIYDGEINEAEVKENRLPKGVSARRGRFRSAVSICYGMAGRDRRSTTIPIGTFDTVEEAVVARETFILNLL